MKTAACPSPIDITPAFSPGPWITLSPLVGSVLSHFFDDLYEQCSDHIEEKIPSSVYVGDLFKIIVMRLNSSLESPCSSPSSIVGLPLTEVMRLSPLNFETVLFRQCIQEQYQ